MKKQYLILSLIVLAAFSTNSNAVEESTVIEQPQTKIDVAKQYLDYSAKKDRQELKAFIGVDPLKIEWCAAFINAVLHHIGLPGSESVSDYPLVARSFLSWGKVVKEPQQGDIVIFPNDKGVTVSNMDIDGYGVVKKGMFLNEQRLFGIAKKA